MHSILQFCKAFIYHLSLVELDYCSWKEVIFIHTFCECILFVNLTFLHLYIMNNLSIDIIYQ